MTQEHIGFIGTGLKTEVDLTFTGVGSNLASRN